eukprot:TRINITY_DN792_c0_g1_i2.p1 TRINITY_DN792_c0_g1~~TRINITY_DN792_c0_g1_i2.p1  ORF type:complete len:593 (+),score=152.94 TRINITY_DN792_c0_g1_i2:419-2197(+)
MLSPKKSSSSRKSPRGSPSPSPRGTPPPTAFPSNRGAELTAEEAKVIKEGTEAVLRLEYEEAERIFAQKEGLQFGVMHALTSVFKVAVDDTPANYKECYKRINGMFDVVKPQCEHCKDIISSSLVGSMFKMKSPKVHNILGGTCTSVGVLLLCKAGLQLKSEKLVKGALNLRRAWKLMEAVYAVVKAEKMDEGLEDSPPDWLSEVLFGFGVFQFIVSLVPPAYKWMVEAMGFTGDRKLGFEKLILSAKGTALASVLSRLAVIGIDQLYLDEVEYATQELEKMLTDLPHAIPVVFMAGWSLREAGRIDRALELFSQVERESTNAPKAIIAAKLERGFCLERKQQWQNAAECIQSFLDETDALDRRSWSAYELGMCLCHLGKVEEAKPWFKIAVKTARPNYTWDSYAARKSAQFMKHGVHPFDLAFHAADLVRWARDYTEALEIIEKFSGDVDKFPNDRKAQYHFLRGRLLRQLKREKDAQTSFKICIQCKPKVESWILPHTLLELAEIHIVWEEPDIARKLLNTCKGKYKEYDYETVVQRNTMRLLESLDGKSLRSESPMVTGSNKVPKGTDSSSSGDNKQSTEKDEETADEK